MKHIRFSIFSILILLSLFAEAQTRRDSVMNFSRDEFKNATNANPVSRTDHYELHRRIADYIQSVDAAKVGISEMNDSLTKYALKTDLAKSGSSAYFYVDRRWTGARGGASWTTQATNAQAGSVANAFPDLWNARDSAVVRLKSGALSAAYVVILGGNTFSFGETDSDFNTNPTTWKRYDTYDTDSTSTTSACLFYNNLHYIAEQGVTLVSNAKQKYNVAFGDGKVGNNSMMTSSYRGGNYVSNYGKYDGNGIAATLNFALRSYYATIDVKFDVFSSKTAGSYDFSVVSKHFSFEADSVKTVDFNFVKLGAQNNGVISTKIFKINTFVTGSYAGAEFVKNIGTESPRIFDINEGGNRGYMKIEIGDMKVNQSHRIFDLNGTAKVIDILARNIELQNGLSGVGLSSVLHMEWVYQNTYINVMLGKVSANNQILYRVTRPDLNQYDNIAYNHQTRFSCEQCETTDTLGIPAISVRLAGDTLSKLAIFGNYTSKNTTLDFAAASSNYAFQKILVDATLTSYRNSPLKLSVSAPNLLFKGQLVSSGSEPSVSGAGTLTILPSATANNAAGVGITTQGATLNVNSAFRF